MQTIELPALLSPREVAELLGIRPQTLAKWRMTAANLPFVRVGPRRIRYRREDVLALIERGIVGGGEGSEK